MDKKEIIEKLSLKLDNYEDIDDKLDCLSELLEEYQDHPDFQEIFSSLYQRIDMTSVFNKEDPILTDFYNVLESTNELILNENYEEVINLLAPHQKLVDELLDISSVDKEKFDICCFFNEIEKQMFYYMESNPNKDIHLLNPYAGEYYSRLALVFHNSLNYNKAFECYKKILTFNPCSNQALLGMAYLSFVQENYLTALEYIKEFSKYAFSNDMIFDAYQILTNIYLQLAKYDYAAVFAMIGSSFAPTEEKEEDLISIYNNYKKEINFDIDSDEELDKFLADEEFVYMPNDRVMDVLYTMLLEYKNHENMKEDYLDMAQIILSLVEDDELTKEYEKLLKEYN